ncbi:MAG TPA: peptide chain release factor N(5)-glutamine methyltransferase, partial [Chitinophagaceae bacterium]|nr:peptide chain release factor N(5)-glutamine methyltransferase [Chitinophagaceae bacterium]
LDKEQEKQFQEIKAELLSGKPMQYVLGYGWFMGRKFVVNSHVLIPRPETEELVQWIANDHKRRAPKVLDIGTGSGCIPVMLKILLPDADITSIDLSNCALEVAKQNAENSTVEIRFRLMDFLDKAEWEQLERYDIIVSNPPYIPETEKDTLHANVRDFEPGQALFVPGDDALLFYRNIAAFGLTHLQPHGSIYCELHVDHARATEELFIAAGYATTELRKDMHGNLRMLKASK